jgi:hypothetical protein
MSEFQAEPGREGQFLEDLHLGGCVGEAEGKNIAAFFVNLAVQGVSISGPLRDHYAPTRVHCDAQTS